MFLVEQTHFVSFLALPPLILRNSNVKPTGTITYNLTATVVVTYGPVK